MKVSNWIWFTKSETSPPILLVFREALFLLKNAAPWYFFSLHRSVCDSTLYIFTAQNGWIQLKRREEVRVRQVCRGTKEPEQRQRMNEWEWKVRRGKKGVIAHSLCLQWLMQRERERERREREGWVAQRPLGSLSNVSSDVCLSSQTFWRCRHWRCRQHISYKCSNDTRFRNVMLQQIEVNEA